MLCSDAFKDSFLSRFFLRKGLTAYRIVPSYKHFTDIVMVYEQHLIFRGDIESKGIVCHNIIQMCKYVIQVIHSRFRSPEISIN